ncbi:Aldehyde oxidase/xanthine dehydrogenase, first molybdopterin binding domain, partial [Dillenia turbinata]
MNEDEPPTSVFYDMEEESKSANSLVFAVNGERFEVSSIDPSTTVLEFLRTRTRFKSVKLGCGEGGCGACVVLVSKYDLTRDHVEDFTVSSCLTLLCSINGCSITTTEGLGNGKDGLHPIHQRFAGFHASQCGFCTPGMCVSLFSSLVNAEKAQRRDPAPGFSKLTVHEAEKSIAGNLCRCTGYRPIADACKSFAGDVDIEDLGLNSFWKKEENKEVKVRKLPLCNLKEDICTYPEFLKSRMKLENFLDSKRYQWYTPVKIEEVWGLLQCGGERVKLVAGNTGTGYYKELEPYSKYIDLRYIPELSMIKKDHMGIEIGATVTISKAILALKEENNSDFPSGDLVFRRIADHMEKIASGFVRNSASIGGNLVMAQRNQFPSDIATVLLGAGSMVEILSGHKRERITLEDFLREPPMNLNSILLSVYIPRWEPAKTSSGTISKLLFETYRAAPRPLGNALPYLNAAFLVDASPCKASNGFLINNIHLAFGAYGTKHAVRARSVENFLAGKVFNYGVLYEAIRLVRDIVVPNDGISHPAYRTSLAVGYLFDLLHPLLETGGDLHSSYLEGCANTSVRMAFGSKISHDGKGPVQGTALLSPSKQVMELTREFYPVGEPLTKSGAALQASGEALFVDDIPSPTNCVYGAFIYSTKPLARVKNIRFKSDLLPDGVISIVSYKDIPEGAENIGSKTVFGPEPLFADDVTRCAGQRLAVVVADTQKHANLAASIAEVDYDIENMEPPILFVKEAVDRSSFFEVPPFLYPREVGDFAKEMSEADHKILSAEIKLGSQYYFYMETQTALAVPDEDNCMVVYSSIQCPEYAHDVIASCLGVPGHNVRVITRRVGGGFGGKAIRAMPVATACAVAAQKLRRPVRMYLDRKTDMIMAGGRHPMEVTYDVGFKSNGKITALRLTILINAGYSVDISAIIPHNLLNTLKKYDWGALSFDIKVCRTNHTSKSAMRAPGEVQGSFIAEAVIEHVASTLSMDVDSVRDRNLHTFRSLSLFYENSAGEAIEYTLTSIWDKLANSSSFNQRKEIVDQFNCSNKWKKRGISRVPVIHGVTVRPTPGKVSIFSDGSVVVECGGVEIGQGLYTKVKQMAAYALKLIQCDEAGDFLERVRVIQADSLSLIQGGFTAGSTSSESSCEAVRLCCDVLVERLTPVKVRLQEQVGSVTWDMLVRQAYMQAVNMSASSFYVEVNLLTGETTMLQSDIIYDCGQSLNPAVDLGQIEGAFVQGIGFFMLEEYLTNADGLVVSDSTWTYKIPTIDTIPKQFNVEILNSGHHHKRVLSSKASGEPPLLLAVSIHCATRAAIREARKQILSWRGVDTSDSPFQLEVPATMPIVKSHCGLDIVETYLSTLLSITRLQ